MKGKIEEIASRLDLSSDDVNELKKERVKWNIIYLIGGIIIVIIAFILGLLLGKALNGSSSSDDGYPFNAMVFGSVASTRFSRPTRFSMMLMTIAAFLAGISAPVFGQAVKYGVYERKELILNG